MDPRSGAIFNENEGKILSKASEFFETSSDSLKRLGSFESFVFEFETDNKPYILKITHDLHRTHEAICGELDWVDHLYKNDVSVACPVYSINDRLVETIKIDSSLFFVYAFDKINGKHITLKEFDKALIIEWGRVTGKMHAVTKSYQPSQSSWKRHGWEDEISKYANNIIPDN